MLDKKAMEYVAKEEVSEVVRIKQMELEIQKQIREKEIQL